ncbi:hypothetical protein AQUCO_00200158v1 [Aquilegia coerulea]|uniref:HAT C-terminal dimerisation domain-containing protein n=1 Tax=Aquilegia coerulea TaxID=218851 RepID=A0A2G5F1W0_AQUCA|nr:hypothetical protein AQUCO_00200158v1 [Aquilegia coerulea]
MMPADWWANFGGDTPQLRSIAVRILAQTVSSSGCERNWSTFGMIHSPKRCKLLDETLHRLVYVHYNLRLKENHYKITEEERKVDLSGLYPPADDDFEDDAFEWVQRSDFPPELDEDGWPNAQVAADMGEFVHEHTRTGGTERVARPTRVQASVDLDEDVTQSPDSSSDIPEATDSEDEPDTPSNGGDSGGNVIIPTGFTEQHSYFRGVTYVDTQSQRQERTSANSQSQRRDSSRGVGSASQVRRGSGSQRRAGKNHATLGSESVIGSRRSCDGSYASQGVGSNSGSNQWVDRTSEPMEIDSGNSWTSSIRDSLPEISTTMVQEYDGFPMTGFLLWGEHTQVSYNFYVESYLKNFQIHGIDWQFYCNTMMMPQETVAPDGTTQGRNSSMF